MNSEATNSHFRIGIRAHEVGCFPADELARRIAATGAECVQLALGKAIEGLVMAPGVLNRALARDIGAAFAMHHIGIEVLGCYINPIHPVPTVRKSLLGLFKEHLHHARDFGCNVVALESGSINADYSPHPGNAGEQAFLDLLDVMRGLVAEAERCGVVVGIEGVACHVLNSPSRMARLLEMIPSPHLQVVFDPVNLLTPANHPDQTGVMRQSFERFGDRIAVVHAKDFVITHGEIVMCPAGCGLLDYGFLLAWFRNHKPGIALILEETGPDPAGLCANFINSGIVRGIP